MRCLNCNTPLIEAAPFCPNCGQSKKEIKLSIGFLFKDFFKNLFNLDGRIWNTLRNSWKPAFLTKEYVSGRRTSYYSPIRFFSINLIFLFILFSYAISQIDLGLGGQEDAISVAKSELLAKYDSLVVTEISSITEEDREKMKLALFGDVKAADQDTIFKGFTLANEKGKLGILKKDAYTMDIEDIYKKYNITGRLNKIALRQIIRINKNRDSSLSFILGNLSWGIILSLFSIAGLMWVVYIRNQYYYVEHAVLLLLIHAKIFLLYNILISVGLLFAIDDKIVDNMSSVAMIIAALYILLTLKVYYQQGWIKTIVKYVIIMSGYILLLIFFAVIVSIIGAAIF